MHAAEALAHFIERIVSLTITQRDDSLGAVTQPELRQGGWFAIGLAREGPIGD